jgi:hypothetical protein
MWGHRHAQNTYVCKIKIMQGRVKKQLLSKERIHGCLGTDTEVLWMRIFT